MTFFGRVDPKPVHQVQKVHTLIGAITGFHVMVLLIVLPFLVFSAHESDAQTGEVYSPCWSQEECLNLNGNPGSSAVTQPDSAICANGRCFCVGSACRDPHRPEPSCPGDQGKCYSNPPPVPLTVTIGGASSTLDIGDYIAKVYNYGVSIAGILAGVMFVVGGFQYLSAGSSGRVAKAKERIRDALVGLLLVLGAYVILNTINPDVLRLQMPKVALVKKKLFVACQYFEMQRPCGQAFTLVRVTGVPDSAAYSDQYRISTGPSDTGGTSTTSCIGKSCSRAGSNDAGFRCRIPPGASTTAAATNAAAAAPSTQQCISAPVAPYQCLPCKRQGEDCRGSGPSTECCGGFCSPGAIRAGLGDIGAMASATSNGHDTLSGFCTNGNNGVQCGVDNECFSHHCVDVAGSGLGGICASGENGAPCREDKDCNAGKVCDDDTGVHVCVIPNYYSPCNADDDCPGGLTCNDHRCGGNVHQSCTNDDGCANLIGVLAQFGPMRCWTDSQVTGSAMNFCKPFIQGTVCIPGGNQNECGPQETCFDGAISDRSIRGAGLCSLPIGGGGCDETSECQRVNPRSSCRQYQGITGGNKGCSLRGTAGIPCIGSGTGGGVSNTCEPGLDCPDGVFRCVEPPETACPH